MGIFKKAKNAAVKKLLQSQLKKQGADDAQISLLMEMIDTDPEFFDKIGKEVEERVKNGEDQMTAAQSVFMAHQAELQRVMMKDPKMLQKMKIEAMKMQASMKKK